MSEHSAEKDAHVPVLDYDSEQEVWVCADHGMPECRQGDCASLPWLSADYDAGRSLLAVYRAIATVEDSRRTHAEWLDHWRRMESEGHEDCARCIETAKVAGGREHQEKCIEEYDNVLAVLRNVVPPGVGDGR